MDNNRHKSYTIRKAEDNLKGTPGQYTVGSDVGNEPFPFTEEDNETKEQLHFRGVDRNRII